MSKLFVRVCLLFAACMAGAPSADAIPRFAARNGAACTLCHVNPAGGGMRNDYGRNVYAAYTLPMGGGDRDRATLDPSWDWGPDLGVSVGADMRTVALWVDTEYRVDPSTNELFRLTPLLSFFLMQADVYGELQLGEKLSLYIDYGVASGNVETFGLIEPGLFDAYLKVGYFLPQYGLKLPNHRTYIREEGLGLEPNLRDSGVELGISPGPVGVNVSVFNGLGGADGLNPDFLPAASGRVDVTHRGQALKATLGVSGWYEPGGEVDLDGNDMTTLEMKGGAYLMASAGRFTLLAEGDFRRTSDAAAETQLDSLMGYGELAFLPMQGLDIQLVGEWYDPDTELLNNTLVRAGGGFELFPLPNLELKTLYRHTFGDAEAAAEDPRTFFTAASAGTDELLVFFHVYL